MKSRLHAKHNTRLPPVGVNPVPISIVRTTESQPQSHRPVRLQPIESSKQMKHELVSRLYGQGVPKVPLPSIRRNFDLPGIEGSFSAQLKHRNRGETLSPIRKDNQSHNVTANDQSIEKDLEDDFHSPLKNLNMSAIQPQREEVAVRGQLRNLRLQRDAIFSTGKSSITGMSIMSSLKPKAGISIDHTNAYSLKSSNMKEARKMLNLSVMESKKVDVSKNLREEINMSQELDLSPQEHFEKQLSSELIKKMRKLPLEEEKGIGDIQINVNNPNANKFQEEERKTAESQVWQDLDKKLEELLEDSELVTTKFMYFNNRKDSDNPYDLKMCKYNERDEDRFITISGKGVTQYLNNKAVDFIPLGSWLIERDLYSHIKEIPFFKHFKKWKLLNAWRTGLLFTKRKHIVEELTDKLFFLNDIYREHLLKHRKYMCEMSQLRFIEIQKQGEAFEITEFEKRQKAAQKQVTEKIQDFNKLCRTNFMQIITRSLEALRNRIRHEKTLDEDKNQTKKNHEGNKILEALDFPENLTYGHRAALRNECMRILRAAYLVDFLAITSLGNIYLESVKEALYVLKRLDMNANPEINVAHDILHKNQEKEPVLEISLEFFPKKAIPPNEIVSKQVKEFSEKLSKPKEFDMGCHVEIAPEHEEQNVPRGTKKYITQEVPNIVSLWLDLKPSKDEFMKKMLQCFKAGEQVVENFERWNHHDDLTPFATVLEEWDEIVGGNWEEPEGNKNNLSPKSFIGEQEIYLTQETVLNEIVTSAYSKSFEFLAKLKKYLHLYWANKQADLSLIVHERVIHPVETMTNALKLLEYQKKLFLDKIPETCNIGMLKIDCSQFRKKLLPSPGEVIKKIEEIATTVLRARVEQVKEWMNVSKNELQLKVETVDDYVRLKIFWNKIAGEFQDMKDKIDIQGNLYNIMTDAGIVVKKDDKAYHSEALQQMMQLSQIASNVSDKQELDLDKFKKKLQEQLIPQLSQELEHLKKDIEDEKLLTKENSVEDNLQKIQTLEVQFKSGEESAKKYNSYQKTLNMEVVEFALVDEARTGLYTRFDLWKSLKEWNILTQEWISQQFSAINLDEIDQKSSYYDEIALRVDKTLPENPVSKELKFAVEKFKKAVPIILALRNVHLEAHHWKEIKELLKSDFKTEDPDFTLKSFLDLNAIDYLEDIEQISIQATQESILKKQLSQLDEQWRQVIFSLKNYPKYKDMYLLTEVDILLNMLDESIAKINSIIGSKYIKPLLTQAENWRSTLLNLQSILDEWVTCQHKWLYMDNIFSSQEIKKQLANEAVKFDIADKFFKGLMQRAFKSGNPLKILKTYKGDLLDNIRKNNKLLDEVEKMLEIYLETKRKDFPRFCFLSNDELLEILANQQDLAIVQKNIKKCFENLIRLQIHENLDISSMVSSEGETLQFFRPSKVKDNIEVWLENVQNNIKETLYRSMKSAQVDLDTLDRKDWVIKYPAQVSLTISQVMWCIATEASIQEMATNQNAMMEWYEDNISQIQQITEMVRGKLDPVIRKTSFSLLLSDMHGREVLENLVLSNIALVSDYNWQRQLRFYWEEDEYGQPIQLSCCFVKQGNIKIEYGYEYIGPSLRCVVTPLTEKCWLAITNSVSTYQGGVVAGPTGSGKTESIKDLSKILGIYCVAYNCSEQMNCKMTSRIFSGAVQQGAWICLDDLNRTKVEVLSVIARQMNEIFTSLKIGNTPFIFEEKEIAIKGSCGIIATLNPFGNKFIEMPENLKSQFRQIAMMTPDFEQICEITLFAEGFTKAKIMTKKLIKFFKLATEQLSNQKHYDFSIRALKNVLYYIASLKHSEAGANEEALLIRSIKDSISHKLVPSDLQLFQGLLKDLFPTIGVDQPQTSIIQKQIELSFSKAHLENIPILVEKTKQLFDLLAHRFGVILVGPPGSGKSTCIEILKDSMTTLRKEGSADEKFQNVTVEVLNPKAIDITELYGELNIATQEWRDGLVSKLLREAANEVEKDRNWIIFDGPIDDTWIENLNSVLDDSMTLCLSNGQRLKLRKEMNILFEVQSLENSSPGIVSRCDVIFIPGDTISWKSYIKTWAKKSFVNENLLNLELQELLLFMFEQAFERSIVKIRTVLHEPIKTSDLQLAASICNILEAFLTEDICTGDKNDKKKKMTQIFAYSFIWGMGGPLDEMSKEKMDFLLRNIFENVDIPGSQTVFDYYMNPAKELAFRPWAENVPLFCYNKDLPFHELVVPTVEIIRQSYYLEHLICKEKQVFFTGAAGIGKSMIIQRLLANMQKSQSLVPVQLTFSAYTSSLASQLSIEENLQKKRRDLYGAQVGQKIVIFIDDVNMPALDKYGTAPPIELLRLLVDKHGFYDREKLYWKSLEDTTIICSAVGQEGGRNALCPRFTRKFNIVCLSQPNKNTLQLVFQTLITDFMKDGKVLETVQTALQDLINGTIDFYQTITEQLKPTPSHFYYVFTMRDISKVFQGMMMVKPATIKNVDVLSKLWVHELSRVFADKVQNKADKEFIGKLAAQLSSKYLKTVWEYDDVMVKGRLIWTDTLKLNTQDCCYEETKDIANLRSVLNEKLENYNTKNNSNLEIVFFDEAIDHILRISRVLRQPKGNVMLIGTKNSGKAVLVKLASFMQNLARKEIENKKDESGDIIRNLLKEAIQFSGVKGEQLCLLLKDSLIPTEGCFDYINSLLLNGEIPNIFSTEERDKIVGELRPKIAELKRDESRESIYIFLVERIRKNLRICLCMSSNEQAFKTRCRNFPALINCCQINWFMPWPSSAILSISSQKLLELENTEKATKDSFAEILVEIHKSAEAEAELVFAEENTKIYITPQCCIDIPNLYSEILTKKQKEYTDQKAKIKGGLDKLQDVIRKNSEMKKRIEELQPRLKERSEILENAQKKTSEDNNQLGEKERAAAIQGEKVAEISKKVKAISDEIEAELSGIKPEFDAIMNEVKQLDRKSIIEIKGTNTPNQIIVTVMEAVMTLLEEKSDWNNIKYILSDSGEFVNKLVSFGDKITSVPESTIKKLRETYISNKEFDADQAGNKAIAAKTFVKWVKTMNSYYDIIKKVDPKKKSYDELKAGLDVENAILAEKAREANEAKSKILKSKTDSETLQADRNKFSDEMSLTRRRQTRGEELIGILTEEATRWRKKESLLQDELDNLDGNAFLFAACISYLGPFPGSSREKLLAHWRESVIQHKIQCYHDFSFSTSMFEPATLSEWQSNGLPNDKVSFENAIIAMESLHYPLIIDPQYQASKWLKNIHKKAGLIVISVLTTENLKSLVGYIKVGKHVLIEGVEESLDPFIEPILEKQVYQNEGGVKFLKMPGKNIEYNSNFRLFMTTKLAHPHYMPETCSKVALINFTITSKGLEEQLLGELAKIENPDMETKLEELVKQLTNDKKTLFDSEENILKQLTNSSLEQVLDEDTTIDTLKNIKATSSEATARSEETAKMEAQVTKLKESYRTVAIRCSTLFFIIMDMMKIDSMYQYSLEYIKQVILAAIDKSPKGRTEEERINILTDYITRAIFANISRGLAQIHKKIFAFFICTKIKKLEGIINEKEWKLFIHGAKAIKKDVSPNPLEKYINNETWEFAICLEKKLPEKFGGLIKDFTESKEIWEKFAAQQEVLIDKLPGKWESKLGPFERLLILKIFKPHKLMMGVIDYIRKEMGQFYVESYAGNIDETYQESKRLIPIVLILSPGIDPTYIVTKLAEEHRPKDKLTILSLGQGQGATALAAIQTADSKGNWLLLNNCHLMKSWLKELPNAIDALKDSKTGSEDFRLILASFPTEYFPNAILQNSVKFAVEPYRGLKANLKHYYQELPQAKFSGCTKKPNEWQKLLFSLYLFHAIVKERCKFGSFGFNQCYDFNQNDLESSSAILQKMLEEQENIPWDSLIYSIGQMNYCGHVTDEFDHRCLLSILRNYISPEILTEGHKFSSNGIYYPANFDTIDDYKQYIDSLPINDPTEVFGIPEYANIPNQINDSNNLIQEILKVHKKDLEEVTSKANDTFVLEIIGNLEQKIPKLLDIATAKKELFAPVTGTAFMHPYSAFLQQEIERYNSLLKIIGSTLEELSNSIKGNILMSREMENMYDSILSGKVPEKWSLAAYPSMKGLNSWFADLLKRISFFVNWLTQGTPSTFWLPAIFFPQGFLTSTLQTFARKFKVPLDNLSFRYKIMNSKEEFKSPPLDGVYIYGLFMEAARWDEKNQLIIDPLPNIIHTTIPHIWFLPTADYQIPAETYSCPIFKTSQRKETYITCIDIHTNLPADYWTIKGTAIVCEQKE